MDWCQALTSAFVVAARDGQTEIVELLLEAGADVHAWEDVALRLAADGGHVETIQALLEAGADVHAENDESLHGAEENCHSEAARLLQQWAGRRVVDKPPSPPM